MQTGFTESPVLPDLEKNLEDQTQINFQWSFSLRLNTHAAKHDWIVKSGYGRTKARHKSVLCGLYLCCSQQRQAFVSRLDWLGSNSSTPYCAVPVCLQHVISVFSVPMPWQCFIKYFQPDRIGATRASVPLRPARAAWRTGVWAHGARPPKGERHCCNIYMGGGDGRRSGCRNASEQSTKARLHPQLNCTDPPRSMSIHRREDAGSSSEPASSYAWIACCYPFRNSARGNSDLNHE